MLSGFNILFIRLNGNFAEKAQAEINEKLLFTQENDRLQTAQEEYPFQAPRNAYPACRIIWISSVASRNLVWQIHDRTNVAQFLAKHSQRSTRNAPPHIPQVD